MVLAYCVGPHRTTTARLGPPALKSDVEQNKRLGASKQTQPSVPSIIRGPQRSLRLSHLVRVASIRRCNWMIPLEMTVKSSMESYEERLKSFDVTHPPTKKRASDPKGKRTHRWPHKRPAAREVCTLFSSHEPVLIATSSPGPVSFIAQRPRPRITPNATYAIVI